MSSKLTRYPEGSIRELWSVSFPLMISTFATLFMIFTDRIFLARYSLGALNASVNAGTLAWAFMAGIGMITGMSEIFVAQYNGAKKYDRLGIPVWQMIWFSFFSLAFFIPLAIWGGPLIFQNDPYAEMEIVYFRWLMLFGPSYALMTAFGGFFIGRGKTRVLIALAILANVVNILLDWVLIFGVPGWIPEMGIQGAAIATCFGYVLEASILACLFLGRENREKYGSGLWQFNREEFRKCLKVGFPQGVFNALEVFGWSVFYWMMTSLSATHITVSSICQSFTILLSFFCDGLSRGAAAVAGNFIGARQHEFVGKVLRSGLILLAAFTVVTSFFLVIDSKDTVQFLFFQQFEGIPGTASEILDPEFASALRICLVFAYAYLFFEGVRWVLSGLLVAAGDTLFLLIAGSLSVWVLLLAPIYLIVVRHRLPVEYAWGITIVYSMLLFSIYWIRFKRGAWKKIDLVSPAEPLPEERAVEEAAQAEAPEI